MAWHSAGCSSKRFEVQVCRNISAPITIRCIGFINGRRTSEFWSYGNQDGSLHSLVASVRRATDRNFCYAQQKFRFVAIPVMWRSFREPATGTARAGLTAT